jgi:hypothetical protein
MLAQTQKLTNIIGETFSEAPEISELVAGDAQLLLISLSKGVKPRRNKKRLDSHFKCDTELRGEGLDWCFEAEALSGC